MPGPGPRTTYKYSEEFKATAVRLNNLPGVEVQDVADSLHIHPFMLSRWRKQVREGVIVAKGSDIDKEVAAELKGLRKLKKAHLRMRSVTVAARPALSSTATMALNIWQASTSRP